MLADEFGVSVEFGVMNASDSAITNPATRTMTIDHRLEMDDVSYLIRDLWSRLTIGPHASVAIELPGPMLTLVPTRADEAPV